MKRHFLLGLILVLCGLQLSAQNLTPGKIQEDGETIIIDFTRATLPNYVKNLSENDKKAYNDIIKPKLFSSPTSITSLGELSKLLRNNQFPGFEDSLIQRLKKELDDIYEDVAEGEKTITRQKLYEKLRSKLTGISLYKYTNHDAIAFDRIFNPEKNKNMESPETEATQKTQEIPNSTEKINDLEKEIEKLKEEIKELKGILNSRTKKRNNQEETSFIDDLLNDKADLIEIAWLIGLSAVSAIYAYRKRKELEQLINNKNNCEESKEDDSKPSPSPNDKQPHQEARKPSSTKATKKEQDYPQEEEAETKEWYIHDTPSNATPETPAATPQRETILYAEVREDRLEITDSDNRQHYKITIDKDNPKRGKFEVTNNEEMIKKMIPNRQTYIDPLCDTEGYSGDATTIQTLAPGTVETTNGQIWEATQKAKVKFIKN